MPTAIELLDACSTPEYNPVILLDVKTAISIPDDVFRKAERLAKARKLSRSQLYTAAIVRMLEAEPKDDVTRAYDSAFADDHHDGFVDDAARTALLDVEWSE